MNAGQSKLLRAQGSDKKAGGIALEELTFGFAGKEDAALAARMNRQLILDEQSENPMSLDELEARMLKLMASGYTCAILRLDAAIAGYALYQLRRHPYDAERQEIYLRQYYIEPAYRGRGIGRAGVQLLQERAFPPGATVIIDVLSSNPAGERFWRSAGFEAYAITMRKR
ncbi:GNAT family N-acetyltransferase [Paenibacillus sp. R14(2021)]|uniref:GNAT family N-acetyltransferase n=1 Tax=Paenibacillus sp. R14(2021) TaxID=2859228 RepID=UPI001C6151B3|nr:GNAT family N-acetyltransferase [Paenibacillus sp. R14(2021)]